MDKRKRLGECLLELRRMAKNKDPYEYMSSLSFFTYSCIDTVCSMMLNCGFSIVKFDNVVLNKDETLAVHGIVIHDHDVEFIISGGENIKTTIGELSDEAFNKLHTLPMKFLSFDEKTVKNIGHLFVSCIYAEFMNTLHRFMYNLTEDDIEHAN